ncbi:MAG: hypothetical protein ACUVUU_09890 [bacterium]
MTAATIGLAVFMGFMFGHYTPGVNGHPAIAAIVFVTISFLHGIGHWLVCEFFGGSVASLGIGLLYWVIPFFWTDIGDIWCLNKRMALV